MAVTYADGRYHTRAAAINSASVPVLIAGWIKPGLLNVDQAIFSIGDKDATTAYRALMVGSTGVFRVRQYRFQETSTDNNNGQLTLNQWQHVAGWYSGDGYTSWAWLNGANKTTRTYTGGHNDLWSRADTTRMGNVANSNANVPYTGAIEHMAVWVDITPSDADIAALAAGGDPAAYQPSKLKAYYKLLSVADPVPDDSGNGNTLAAVGTSFAVEGTNSPVPIPNANAQSYFGVSIGDVDHGATAQALRGRSFVMVGRITPSPGQIDVDIDGVRHSKTFSGSPNAPTGSIVAGRNLVDGVVSGTNGAMSVSALGISTAILTDAQMRVLSKALADHAMGPAGVTSWDGKAGVNMITTVDVAAGHHDRRGAGLYVEDAELVGPWSATAQAQSDAMLSIDDGRLAINGAGRSIGQTTPIAYRLSDGLVSRVFRKTISWVAASEIVPEDPPPADPDTEPDATTQPTAEPFGIYYNSLGEVWIGCKVWGFQGNIQAQYRYHGFTIPNPLYASQAFWLISVGNQLRQGWNAGTTTSNSRFYSRGDGGNLELQVLRGGASQTPSSFAIAARSARRTGMHALFNAYLNTADTTVYQRPDDPLVVFEPFAVDSNGDMTTKHLYIPSTQQYIHFRYCNDHSNCSANFSSFNWVAARSIEPQADSTKECSRPLQGYRVWNQMEAGRMYRSGQHTPHFQMIGKRSNGALFAFSQTVMFGHPSLDNPAGSTITIGGTRRVRQRFNITGGPRTFDRVSFKMGRSAGTGSLTVDIYNQSNRASPLTTLTITADNWQDWTLPGAIQDDSNPKEPWLTRTINLTLANGSYAIEFSAPAGTTFVIPFIIGTEFLTPANRAAIPTQNWTDRAEFSTNGGSTWTGGQCWNATNRSDMFVPVALRMVV